MRCIFFQEERVRCTSIQNRGKKSFTSTIFFSFFLLKLLFLPSLACYLGERFWDWRQIKIEQVIVRLRSEGFQKGNRMY